MERHAIKKSLRASFWDGVFAACMMGLTQEYFTPYALTFGAKPAEVGALTALPNVANAFAQLHSPDLTDKVKSRKKMICFFVFLQALTLVPIAALAFLFKAHRVAALIICVTLFTSFNAFALPAWQSLMSDYLPFKKRGRYFGWRNKTLGAVTVGCLLGAGLLLQSFRTNLLWGFVLIFGTAALCRFVCVYFLCRMYEQRQHSRTEAMFSFLDFLRRAPESNFAKFVFFVSAFTFCVYLASPFFSVFMLKDLKFDYLTYTVLVTTVSVATILTIDRWGRSADRIGNMRVMRLTALFIASLPFWWIVNQHRVFLFCAQVLSGIAWAGFNLCALNFIYDAVTPAKRTRCFAYFSVCNGTAICLGSLTGGFLATRLPVVFGWRLLSLFFLSGVLRFMIALSLPAKIREVRAIETISTKDLLLRIIGLKAVVD